MESIEMNEIVATEAMTDLMDETTSSGVNGVKAGVLVGVSMILGAAAYEKVVKPAGRWIGRKITGIVEARKAKKTEAYDLEKIDCDIPDIE